MSDPIVEEADPLILVKRGPQDWQEAKYRLSKIQRIHSDSVTGGVMATAARGRKEWLLQRSRLRPGSSGLW